MPYGNTNYNFRVRAYNESTGTWSAYTNIVVAKTYSTEAPPAPLSAPTNLTATTISTTQINIAWTDNSSDETGFTIKRLEPSKGAIVTYTVGANVQSFQNTGLMPNASYSYHVYANNSNCTYGPSDCNSAWSNEASATTQTIPIPATPSNLSATAVSRRQINLSWSDNSTNETCFRIERATAGGSFIEIATTVTNATSYQDVSSLASGTTYQYRICAWNAGGSSAYSGTVSAITHSNIAQGKTASASSYQSSSYTASKGNDGSTTTKWRASSTSVPQWWKVDLGSSKTISGSEVMWELSGVIYKYRIQTSTNNSTWTTRVDLTNNTNTSQIQSHTFSATARYVRIYITSVPSGHRASLFEFRVFGQ